VLGGRGEGCREGVSWRDAAARRACRARVLCVIQASKPAPNKAGFNLPRSGLVSVVRIGCGGKGKEGGESMGCGLSRCIGWFWAVPSSSIPPFWSRPAPVHVQAIHPTSNSLVLGPAGWFKKAVIREERVPAAAIFAAQSCGRCCFARRAKTIAPLELPTRPALGLRANRR